MMSRIDKQNYEAFYLDYAEGRLDPETVQELFDFLDAHPELKAELEDFEVLQLNADPISDFDKEALKQHIDDKSVEDYIIASVENVIDKEDEDELAAYLEKSEEARKLADRYKKTILPKPDISYPEKNILKKRNSTIYYLLPLAAAAAVILLLLIVNPFQIDQEPTPIASTGAAGNEEQIQQQEEIISEKTIPDEEMHPQEVEEIGLNKEVKTQNEIVETTSPESTIQIDDPKQPGIPDDQPDPLQGLPEPEYRDAYGLTNLEPKTMESLANVSENDLILPAQDIDRPVVVDDVLNSNLAMAGSNPEHMITKKRGLNLLRIAEISVKGFAMLNERSYALERHYTETGELESVTLVTNRRRITTPAI